MAPVPTVPGVAPPVPVVPERRPLFQPFPLSGGRFPLKHRLVLAPLTRCRSDPEYVPAKSAVDYYSQRAAAPGTLLITEAAPISPQACGYPNTPGLWTEAQVEAWRPVVKAVREGRQCVFAAQLWHVGRASCELFQPGGLAPVSASAIAVPEPWTLYGPRGEGPLPYPTPRALTAAEIDAIVEDYAAAARNAVQGAGFDLVEIHAANGYLISQFLSDGTNERADEYGGSVENRARLLLRVVQRVADELGDASKVGVRLSPFNEFLACVESDPLKTYGYAVQELLKIRAKKNGAGGGGGGGGGNGPLAYLHFVEPRLDAAFEARDTSLSLLPYTRPCKEAGVTVITAGAWEPRAAAEAVARGEVDLVCLGREWIGAPDLPKRWALGLRGNKGDRSLYYSGGDKGYCDYPPLSAEEERAAVERARELAAAP